MYRACSLFFLVDLLSLGDLRFLLLDLASLMLVRLVGVLGATDPLSLGLAVEGAAEVLLGLAMAGAAEVLLGLAGACAAEALFGLAVACAAEVLFGFGQGVACAGVLPCCSFSCRFFRFISSIS